ncbi:MAG: hypothetical protein A2032_01310 [Chloroflexi bacterium RBG_19FT_COMBO_49_13]|nr:MAG: hypothetical protein A2032_01310 [Chloroflexi bacterium RBG_19FT_COMBO_49_13]
MKRYPIIHPFLFAMYPVLAVLAACLPMINPVQAIRPSIAILVITTSILIFLRWIFKDWHRAGFISSMVIIMLFYYGYSYRLPREIHLFDIAISRHLFILSFWVVFLSILVSNWLWKRVRPHVITNFLNISSGITLIYAIYLLAAVWFTASKDPLSNWSRPPNLTEDTIKLNQTYRPDIYYIILDGYAQEDILKEIYHYDNTQFVEYLKNKGFFVAENSHSNYASTCLSLASSLNFEYLDYFAFAADKSTNLRPLMNEMIRSRTSNLLTSIGYKIFISGEYFFAEMRDPSIVFYVPQIHKLATFESLLLQSTMMEILIDLGNINISSYTYDTHREKILNGFAEINSLVPLRGPKFVFIHIIAPHAPFVFNRNGDPIQPDWEYTIFDGTEFPGSVDNYISGYREQLIYINYLTENAINKILQNSPNPPIIVLQSDHGPGAFLESSPESSCLRERFSILSAYYFPNGMTNQLYPSISPVNTFRVIFNTYFGTNLDILPDINYFSSFDYPYQSTDVTQNIYDACLSSEQH